MDSAALVKVALRILKAWTHGEQPAARDVRILKQHATLEETNLSADDLACAVIARECQKTVDAAHASVRKKLRRVG